MPRVPALQGQAPNLAHSDSRKKAGENPSNMTVIFQNILSRAGPSIHTPWDDSALSSSDGHRRLHLAVVVEGQDPADGRCPKTLFACNEDALTRPRQDMELHKT